MCRSEPQVSNATEPTTLPVLPLPDGVILPGMVVTIALESADWIRGR